MHEISNDSAAVNYLFQKQTQCINEFASEYSSFFQFKSIKRFMPPLELSRYEEEVLKSRFHSLAKLQESKFIGVLTEINKKVGMEQVLLDLNEVHMKNEILKEVSSENPSGFLELLEKEEDWLNRKMSQYLLNTLRILIQEEP